jgi:hypothetical protein
MVTKPSVSHTTPRAIVTAPIAADRRQRDDMDKAAVICKLHEIADHYLLGAGTWPADRESLPAFFKTVRGLGLNEDVASHPGTTQSTALGRELKIDLVMAFVGAWDMWEIPFVLLKHGYIEETETDELWTSPSVEAERRLRWLVLRAYFEFCNRSKRAN